MLLRIIGTELPGRDCGDHSNVHVGIQLRREPAQVVPGDVDTATFTAEVNVADRNGTTDFRGPVVQGRPGDRFVYLTWGDIDDRGNFNMFRRAKLMLASIESTVVTNAEQRGTLQGRLSLSDDCGMPRCAAVRPPVVQWSAHAS